MYPRSGFRCRGTSAKTTLWETTFLGTPEKVKNNPKKYSRFNVSEKLLENDFEQKLVEIGQVQLPVLQQQLRELPCQKPPMP